MNPAIPVSGYIRTIRLLDIPVVLSLVAILSVVCKGISIIWQASDLNASSIRGESSLLSPRLESVQVPEWSNKIAGDSDEPSASVVVHSRRKPMSQDKNNIAKSDATQLGVTF